MALVDWLNVTELTKQPARACQHHADAQRWPSNEAIFPHDRVALSLMYGRYTALSAPCPVKK